jgi:predicted acetyltransferase
MMRAMDLHLRPVTDDEYRTFVGLLEHAFAFTATSDDVGELRALTELDRTIGVFDAGTLVATAGAFPFELTLPGGLIEPAAGVTFVTVRGTHRRQGVLRRIMDHQLDDVAARGEALAVLTASEGSIYRRFGYGPATFEVNWTLETPGQQLLRPSTAPGRIRLVERSEAATAIPEVYERCRRLVPGAVDRVEAWWDAWFRDSERDRDGATARHYLLHEDASGTPDGFLGFRLRRKWEHGHGEFTLVADQIHAVDDEVLTALWAFALNHDLVRTISANQRPVDESLRWRLADPRALRTTQLTDALWVRPLDVARTLAARRYATTDALALAITDPFRPANDGTYLLEGGPEGAEAARTDREPDLALDVADLGSIYLGGVRPSTLARAGRITELTPGAVARADLLFSSTPLPYLTTHF